MCKQIPCYICFVMYLLYWWAVNRFLKFSISKFLIACTRYNWWTKLVFLCESFTWLKQLINLIIKNLIRINKKIIKKIIHIKIMHWCEKYNNIVFEFNKVEVIEICQVRFSKWYLSITNLYAGKWWFLFQTQNILPTNYWKHHRPPIIYETLHLQIFGVY